MLSNACLHKNINTNNSYSLCCDTNDTNARRFNEWRRGNGFMDDRVLLRQQCAQLRAEEGKGFGECDGTQIMGGKSC